MRISAVAKLLCMLPVTACGGVNGPAQLTCNVNSCPTLTSLSEASILFGSGYTQKKEGDRKPAYTKFSTSSTWSWDDSTGARVTEIIGVDLGNFEDKEVFFDDATSSHDDNYAYQQWDLYEDSQTTADDFSYDYVQMYNIVDGTDVIYSGYHGVLTDLTAMPLTGTALYNGEAYGQTRLGRPTGPREIILWSGTSTVIADFATKTVDLELAHAKLLGGSANPSSSMTIIGMRIDGNSFASDSDTFFKLGIALKLFDGGGPEIASGQFFGWNNTVPDEVAGSISLSGPNDDVSAVFVSDYSLRDTDCNANGCPTLTGLRIVSLLGGSAYKREGEGDYRAHQGTQFSTASTWDSAAMGEKVTMIRGTYSYGFEVFFADATSSHDDNYAYQQWDLYEGSQTTADDFSYDYVQVYNIVDGTDVIYSGYHGVLTDLTAMPSTGTVTYTGAMQAVMDDSSPAVVTQGTSTVIADFAAKTVALELVPQETVPGSDSNLWSRLTITGMRIDGNSFASDLDTSFVLDGVPSDSNTANGQFFGWDSGVPDEVAGGVSMGTSTGFAIFAAD